MANILPVNLDDPIKVTIDHLQIFLLTSRIKIKRDDLNVVSVDEFCKSLEDDCTLNLFDVAHDAGHQTIQDFFAAENIKMDLHGNLVLPSRQADLKNPAGFYDDIVFKEKKAQLKRKNQKQYITSAKKPSNFHQKETLQKIEDPSPTYQNEKDADTFHGKDIKIHLYGGKVEEIQEGMIIKIANGTHHFVPKTPKFDHSTTDTATVLHHSAINIKQLIREIDRQHKAALYDIEKKSRPNDPSIIKHEQEQDLDGQKTD